MQKDSRSLMKKKNHRPLPNRRGRQSASDQRTNQTIQRQSFRENQDQNHSDEKFGLLGVCSHSSIAHNADGHAGSQRRQSTRETGSKVCVSIKVIICLVRRLINCSQEYMDGKGMSHWVPMKAVGIEKGRHRKNEQDNNYQG